MLNDLKCCFSFQLSLTKYYIMIVDYFCLKKKVVSYQIFEMFGKQLFGLSVFNKLQVKISKKKMVE